MTSQHPTHVENNEISMMPITLYKFMSAEHAKDSIDRQRIKLSTISDLNDPYEMVPSVVDGAGSSIYPTARVRSLMQATASRKCGMICMSKVVDDVLLWSHYGDKHKGMALAFNFPVNSGVVEMKYVHQPVAIDLSGDCGRSQKQDDAFACLLTQKYDGWKYEEECRFILDLPDTREDGHYWKELTPDFLAGVVLGCLCADNETDIESRLTSHGFVSAAGAVSRVRMHPTQFKMEMPPRTDQQFVPPKVSPAQH